MRLRKNLVKSYKDYEEEATLNFEKMYKDFWAGNDMAVRRITKHLKDSINYMTVYDAIAGKMDVPFIKPAVIEEIKDMFYKKSDGSFIEPDL